MKPMKQQLPAYSSNLEKRRIGSVDRLFAYAKDQKTGIETGIAAFDNLYSVTGFVGLLGEPEACKSVLALQIALFNAYKGSAVYFVDMELGEELFLQRLACSASSKCWASWKKLSDKEFKDAFRRLSDQLPIFVNHHDHSLERVISEVEELCEQEERVLLVLDSLQAVTGNNETMRTAIDSWLEALDQLKMRYRKKLTILTTVEKKRGSYGTANKEGGKESGRIEYKLEQQFDLRVNPESGSITVECTKNRHGPKHGAVVLHKFFENQDPTSFVFKLGRREPV